MLMDYKKACQPSSYIRADFYNYDLHMGLWKNENNEPLVKKFLNGEISEVYGTTIETRTREGVDRSESSNEANIVIFQSAITFTRESIDRSETSK
jgi:thymidylate synthase